jgi:hypothetical protein
VDYDIFGSLWLAMTRVIVLHIHLYGYLTVFGSIFLFYSACWISEGSDLLLPQHTISRVASVSETGKKALTQQLKKTSSLTFKANPTLR